MNDFLTNFDAIESNLTEEQEDKIDDLKNRMNGVPTHMAWFVLNRLDWNVDAAAVELGRPLSYKGVSPNFPPPVIAALPSVWDLATVQSYFVFLFVQVMEQDPIVASDMPLISDTIKVYPHNR